MGQRERERTEDVRPPQIVRFELYDPLTAGGSAIAKVRLWNIDTEGYDTSEQQITVYDFEGTHAGIAGDFGRAIYCRDSKRWEVIGVSSSMAGLLGKTDASHAKSASGTVSVWAGTPGSESDTGTNITAYNKFSAVASGKFVWVLNNGDGYYLVAAECDT